LLLALAGCAHRSENGEPPPTGLARPTVEITCGGEFFRRSGGGCAAVLPPSCASGELGLLGLSACLPVISPCEPAKGDLYVRAGAMLGDGSRDKPFGKIAEALAAATEGAHIAIEKGVYSEDLVIAKKVFLEGDCGVVVRGVFADATIEVRASAKIARLELRGPGTCLWVAGAPEVMLDQVWIHDCGARGIEAAGYALGSLTNISRTLIEHVRASGIGAFGAVVNVSDSNIRDVSPRATNPESGDGILARPEKTGAVAGRLSVSRSVIERVRFSAITASAVPASLSLVVIRDIEPIANGTRGLGVYSGNDPPTGQLAKPLDVRDSLIERTHGVGVQCTGKCTLERVTVRDVATENDQFGYGVQLDNSDATVVELAVERCHGAGIVVRGSTATLRSIFVSGILPEGDQFGDGVVVTGDESNPTRITDVTVDRAQIDRCARAGIAVFGSKLTLSSAELACNLIDLNVGRRVGFTASGAPIDADYALTDSGKNNCGCEKAAPCLARAEEIAPIRAH
jgi:hypothetical protein